MTSYEPLQPFTPIGITNWRNTNKVFGILSKDRLQHVYAIGKSGVGKSTLLFNMAYDDIKKGHGIAVLDPHGDVAEKLIRSIPEHRKTDVIYFDATAPAHRTGFNPFANVPLEQRHLVASEIVMMFKRIWGDTWGARLEYILRFSVLTLLDYPTATLLDIQPLLLDSTFRNLVLHYTDNQYILSFWHNEYNNYPATLKAEAIMPILNKAGVFAASETLREIVGQQYGIDLDGIVNGQKILICNLSKGLIGEDVSQILGSLLTTGLQMASMRRASIAEDKRTPFYIFIDEAHSFISNSFTTMLSEVRKFGIGLFLTHQYLEQLSGDLQSAILGNVGTIICFRLGTADAKIMAEEFYPVFRPDDFINLPRYCMYLRLLIDGSGSKPFSAITQKTNVGC
ncbi:type IV secretory system conjugative DNA transfer family protein [Mucilaginibacter sp. HMF5004]|nr:type IV secretory system conjugative DNA transfer family protein [Mucilaginibacter rivuli]MBW4891127.1 type IV secretory system conjugative DNA transfer family protein [Mucilaginibacter rivuli]